MTTFFYSQSFPCLKELLREHIQLIVEIVLSIDNPEAVLFCLVFKVASAFRDNAGYAFQVMRIARVPVQEPIVFSDPDSAKSLEDLVFVCLDQKDCCDIDLELVADTRYIFGQEMDTVYDEITLPARLVFNKAFYCRP